MCLLRIVGWCNSLINVTAKRHIGGLSLEVGQILKLILFVHVIEDEAIDVVQGSMNVVDEGKKQIGSVHIQEVAIENVY